MSTEQHVAGAETDLQGGRLEFPTLTWLLLPWFESEPGDFQNFIPPLRFPSLVTAVESRILWECPASSTHRLLLQRQMGCALHHGLILRRPAQRIWGRSHTWTGQNAANKRNRQNGVSASQKHCVCVPAGTAAVQHWTPPPHSHHSPLEVILFTSHFQRENGKHKEQKPNMDMNTWLFWTLFWPHHCVSHSWEDECFVCFHVKMLLVLNPGKVMEGKVNVKCLQQLLYSLQVKQHLASSQKWGRSSSGRSTPGLLL